jgi:hypothetical protein
MQLLSALFLLLNKEVEKKGYMEVVSHLTMNLHNLITQEHPIICTLVNSITTVTQMDSQGQKNLYSETIHTTNHNFNIRTWESLKHHSLVLNEEDKLTSVLYLLQTNMTSNRVQLLNTLDLDPPTQGKENPLKELLIC